jgi:2-methylisoborneol synthase
MAATASDARVPAGPTGLGTSGLHIGARPQPARERTSIPRLYCPPPVRVNEPLAREVDDRLADWLTGLGVFTDKLDRLRHYSYGSLVMLTHPDSDDPDQLLLAARWAVALWAADDLITDDDSVGADPELVPRRLALALGTMRPPELLDPYADQLQDAMRSDPVLVALRSSLDWIARSATPSQVARARHEVTSMFVMWNANAAWRTAGITPPVWEYLLSRHVDNFVPCMALIDVVGRYELPADVYHDPRVYRAIALAGTACCIANDVYSMAKEQGTAIGDFSLPTVLAAERGCSLQEAVDLSAAYHDDLVRAFEAEHRRLLADPSPVLHRFLLGVRAWLAGNNEWHIRSGRYRLEGN